MIDASDPLCPSVVDSTCQLLVLDTSDPMVPRLTARLVAPPWWKVRTTAFGRHTLVAAGQSGLVVLTPSW